MPAGRLSVNAAPVSGLPLELFIWMVKVDTPPPGIVAGANVLVPVGEESVDTESVALAGVPLLTPWLVESAPAGIVLMWLPGTVEVTSAWKVQLPGVEPTWAGIVAPLIASEPLPAAAVTVAPEQVVEAFGVGAITTPAGRESVTAAPVKSVNASLKRKTVKVEVPAGVMPVGVKLLFSEAFPSSVEAARKPPHTDPRSRKGTASATKRRFVPPLKQDSRRGDGLCSARGTQGHLPVLLLPLLRSLSAAIVDEDRAGRLRDLRDVDLQYASAQASAEMEESLILRSLRHDAQRVFFGAPVGRRSRHRSRVRVIPLRERPTRLRRAPQNVRRSGRSESRRPRSCARSHRSARRSIPLAESHRPIRLRRSAQRHGRATEEPQPIGIGRSTCLARVSFREQRAQREERN